MATTPRKRVKPNTIEEAPYVPVDREVMIWKGDLHFKKAIVEDGEEIKQINLVESNEGGVEIVPIKNNEQAIKALYNFHQTHEAFKDGDTFSRAGKTFAVVSGVHVNAA